MVAKQVLLGRKVVVVGCEDINISGNFYRNKLKYLAFLCKWMNTNPATSLTISTPSTATFGRLCKARAPQDQLRPGCLICFRAFDRILPPYDKKRRMVVPVPSRWYI
uniref:Ribosomal protein L13a n=1 Tax=Molossus molossus TaxID=27622 RepID=A0A7J8EUZ6_MOLMO|nr:ribosomal protein L13a [Molossus molossus]